MSGAMYVEQAGRIDFGVSLRCRQRSVSEQFLDRPQVTPTCKKVCRKAVAKRMRCRRLRQA